MSGVDQELKQLRAELRALGERVSELESGAAERPASVADSAASVRPGNDFWALNGLEALRDQHPELESGVVMLVGSLSLPTGEPVAWQEGMSSEGLVDGDWSVQANVLAALSHPVRLELLRQVLIGVRTTAELAKVDSLGTTGQLHHHLRQLLAAGWLRQSGRGSYEVPPAKVVPLLASVLAAGR